MKKVTAKINFTVLLQILFLLFCLSTSILHNLQDQSTVKMSHQKDEAIMVLRKDTYINTRTRTHTLLITRFWSV